MNATSPPSSAGSPTQPHSPTQQPASHVFNKSERLLMPTVRSLFLHPTVQGLQAPPPPTTTLHPPTPHPPRSPWQKPGSMRRPRHRTASHTYNSSLGEINVSRPHLPLKTQTSNEIGSQWFGTPLRFEVAEESLEIEGYQMYAVEKWIVERNRAVITLTVYTGDPTHKITVTALVPDSSLTAAEAKIEWEHALRCLRRDGARPKETPQGVVTVTSLAQFRSDFTIVHIPSGNFLHAQQQLYANINLLRMGCSGRSALTLEEPSETTKERFITMYHLPETAVGTLTDGYTFPSSAHAPQRSTSASGVKQRMRSKSHSHGLSPLEEHSSLKKTTDSQVTSRPSTPEHDNTKAVSKTRERHLFNTTVLELVKLIQASLSIFGFFPMHSEDGEEVMDGLLCDVTVDGLQRWVAEIGEPCVGVEPIQRAADSTVVAALLSLVLSIRNKLAAIGLSHAVPKDPFLHPNMYKAALASYLQLTSSSSTSDVMVPTPNSVALTRNLVEIITAAYEKSKSSDSRKVHRVFLNKLDDFTIAVAGGDRDRSDKDGGDGTASLGSGGGRYREGDEEREGRSHGRILSGVGSLASGLGIGGGVTGGPGAVFTVTMDMDAFVKLVINGKSRDGHGASSVGASVRGLWTGRVASVLRMREREHERERFLSLSRKEKAAKGDVHSEPDRESERVGTDGGKSTEDESESRRWSERVQRKLESWTGLHRSKRSLDMSSLSRGASKTIAVVPSAESSHRRPSVPPLPSIRSSGFFEGPEPGLSSEQGSPMEGMKITHTLYQSPDSSRPALDSDIPEHDRLVHALKRKRPSPWGKNLQPRGFSWADPKSAEEQSEEGTDGSSKRPSQAVRGRCHSQLGKSTSLAASADILESSREESDEEAKRKRRLLTAVGKRRHSFHDFSAFSNTRVLSVGRMRTDVDLCGQLLVMWRREQHMSDVLACLQALTSSVTKTNASLREEYTAYHARLSAMEAHAKVLAQAEMARLESDRMKQETNTLMYESQQFHVGDLWRMASGPHRKVLDLREKVYGTGGRRLRPGVHGAHGRFNRLQWTLDGHGRLVDALGRTESEAEEEDVIFGRENAAEAGGDEEDVVENPGIKPMWLLNLFNTWATWGSQALVRKGDEGKGKDGSAGGTLKSPEPEPEPTPNTSESSSSQQAQTSSGSTAGPV